MAERSVTFMPFRDDMVLRLLKGEKGQTRRPVHRGNSLIDGGPWDLDPADPRFDWERAWLDPGGSPAGNPGPYLHLPFFEPDDFSQHRVYPRYQPGTLIYVREGLFHDGHHARYRADRQPTRTGRWPWQPNRLSPRGCPRKDSRLTLEVLWVRPERLLRASGADILAEGFACDACRARSYGLCGGQGCLGAHLAFARTWDTLHQRDGQTAAAGPWVWVYSFRVHHRNVDALREEVAALEGDDEEGDGDG